MHPLPLPSLGSIILSATLVSAAFAQAPAAPPHNVVLFVADGLRFRMVDERTAPTMAAIARDGVTLRNSHALFPTFTTANASSMATGHMVGDTGDFSNTIYAGFEVPGAGILNSACAVIVVRSHSFGTVSFLGSRKSRMS